MAQDMCLSPVVTDAGSHDAPYLNTFSRGWLVKLQAIARFKQHGSAAGSELTADEPTIDDRDDDMPLDGPSIAINDHDIIVEDAGIYHAAAADAEYETRRPIEPEQLDQADRIILPILGGAWKAGSCCANDAKNGPLRCVGKRDRLHHRQHI